LKEIDFFLLRRLLKGSESDRAMRSGILFFGGGVKWPERELNESPIYNARHVKHRNTYKEFSEETRRNTSFKT
jgi:hypothetical protein